MGRAGAECQKIQYMLRHAWGITSRYVQVLIGPVKEPLSKTVWPHDGEAGRFEDSPFWGGSGAGGRAAGPTSAPMNTLQRRVDAL